MLLSYSSSGVSHNYGNMISTVAPEFSDVWIREGGGRTAKTTCVLSTRSSVSEIKPYVDGTDCLTDKSLLHDLIPHAPWTLKTLIVSDRGGRGRVTDAVVAALAPTPPKEYDSDDEVWFVKPAHAFMGSGMYVTAVRTRDLARHIAKLPPLAGAAWVVQSGVRRVATARGGRKWDCRHYGIFAITAGGKAGAWILRRGFARIAPTPLADCDIAGVDPKSQITNISQMKRSDVSANTPYVSNAVEQALTKVAMEAMTAVLGDHVQTHGSPGYLIVGFDTAFEVVEGGRREIDPETATIADVSRMRARLIEVNSKPAMTHSVSHGDSPAEVALGFVAWRALLGTILPELHAGRIAATMPTPDVVRVPGEFAAKPATTVAWTKPDAPEFVREYQRERYKNRTGAPVPKP